MNNQHRRPLKIGFVICPVEGGMDGRTAQWTDIMAMAQIARSGGDTCALVSRRYFRVRRQSVFSSPFPPSNASSWLLFL